MPSSPVKPVVQAVLLATFHAVDGRSAGKYPNLYGLLMPAPRLCAVSHTTVTLVPVLQSKVGLALQATAPQHPHSKEFLPNV